MLACHGDHVVLVREAYPAWGGAFWNIPSGRVEDGETAVDGAVRELAEETGLVVPASALRLIGTASTSHGPASRSDATNFRVDLADERPPSLVVADPDGIVQEARWFSRRGAAQVLARLPYRPLREPAVAHLTGGAPVGAHWTYASPDADPVVSLDPLRRALER